MVSPVNAIRLAVGRPITRGSNQAPPSPGTMPTLTKLSAKMALSEEMRMSAMHARSSPAPMAGPLTAAMTGRSRS